MPSKLETAIRKANEAQRKALIMYLPAGYPTLSTFWDELAAIDAVADVIEIGVPFSDPVADGPVIEAAGLACLEAGVTLAWILDELRQRKGLFRCPLVLMGYYNPFLQYGLERLAKDAAAAGVSGFIVPDLPYEEAAPMRKACAAMGLDVIPLVGLNTSPERMRAYAQEARGFAYMVSVLGVTGERRSLPPELMAQLEQAKKAFSIPLAVGFGISRPEQLAAFGEYIDAAVVGTALVRHIGEGGTAKEYMTRWRTGQ